MKIQLSYSTINMLYQASHNWINKQCGLKPEERPEWNEGKIAHRIIQDHVSGKKKDDRLAHIEFSFPIVEEVDFDERCKFDMPLYFTGLKNSYSIIGFMDGINNAEHRLLEIKVSSVPWSLMKFQQLIQRKIYSMARPDLVETIGITGVRNPDNWKQDLPKVYKIPNTNKDRQEAKDWILGGIKIIESGDFKGGLDENGKCTDPRCYFGRNCQFK